MPYRLVRRLNGPRGSVLLGFALLVVPFALAYSPLTRPPRTPPAGLLIISSTVPVAVYGALWGVTAVLCTLAAFTSRERRQRDRLDFTAWAFVVGMLAIWSLAYLAGWLAHLADWPPARNADQAYLQAGIYFGAVFIAFVCARAMPSRVEWIEHLRTRRSQQPQPRVRWSRR